MAQFPPRLYILLAREAPVGLVIRRGPSKRVATILWDRRNDKFQLGQWLAGRIYERQCDLSPDGKYFIYFAMNGKWDSETKGSWTAISRVPYLKAITLFAKGDCWAGGGLWTGNRSYWLAGEERCWERHALLRDTQEVRRDMTFHPADEWFGFYHTRLVRDGWQPIKVKLPSAKRRKTRHCFDKSLDHGWTLRKIADPGGKQPPGKSCDWEEHQLIHGISKREIDLPDWEWADIDGRRLVWATGGRLFAGTLEPDGVLKETELFDFAPMKFEPIKAPY